MNAPTWNRRTLLRTAAALGLIPAWPPAFAADDGEPKMIQRAIPGTSEMLPVVGLGTYSVFDVESTPDNIAVRKEIVELLLAAGGKVIDSSPMYNRSEKVIGDVIDAGVTRNDLFIATKVWTDGLQAGKEQMARSAALMNSPVVDLMQVHNLRDLKTQMASISDAQAAGRIRYSGITEYRSSALPALESAMKTYRPQFIQINYSLGEAEADRRLLPLAQELGIAVLINRPFAAGGLFAAVQGKSLPGWASDFAASWGQFFLKFIVSHPAVNCVIPATSKPRHMIDNLAAGSGALPDNATRARMISFIEAL